MRRERADALAREMADVLAEEGCFRMRIDSVAERAGVAKGTVYLDFATKADLIGSSLARACGDLLSTLEERLAGLEDPRARLRETLNFLTGTLEERPGVRALLEGRLGCAARWAGADDSPKACVERFLASLIEDARTAGYLDPEVDPPLAASILLHVASMRAREGRPSGLLETALRQAALLLPALEVEAGSQG